MEILEIEVVIFSEISSCKLRKNERQWFNQSHYFLNQQEKWKNNCIRWYNYEMILYYKISTSVYALLIHNSLIYGSKLHYLPLAQNQNNQSLVRFQKKVKSTGVALIQKDFGQHRWFHTGTFDARRINELLRPSRNKYMTKIAPLQVFSVVNAMGPSKWLGIDYHVFKGRMDLKIWYNTTIFYCSINTIGLGHPHVY